MCGIFGWSWGDKKPTVRQRETLATVLGTLNDRRGGKGWGWYRPDVDRLIRGTGNIGQVARVLSSAPLVMAHTRWPTVGDESVENSHPFVHGHITGAHNGGIWNWRELNSKYARRFDVDSQHLIAHLAEGKETTELTGYGTVEWADAKDGSGPGIFLCQLTARGDLAVRKTEFGIVWSSEDDHLDLALELAHLDTGALDMDFKSEEVMWVQGGRLFDAQKTLALGVRSVSYDWQDRSDYGQWWANAWESDKKDGTDDIKIIDGKWGELKTSDTCDWCNCPVMVNEMVYLDSDEQLCAECRQYLLTEAKSESGS